MRRRIAFGAAVLMAIGVLVPVQSASADQIRDAEYWLSAYGIRSAWNTTKGAGVTVAVIDSGIDGSHPDLAGVVVGGTDVSGLGSANGQTPVGESKSHGTLVASLIAGRGDGAGTGVLGAAPEATLLSISVAFGVGISTDDQVANAVTWAVDNGADVINMSLTRNALDWPESWDTAFQYAFDHDVVIVAAAGNRGSGTTVVGAPATIPGVVAVAGVDKSGKTSFSASSQGVTIAVSAPSERLVGATAGGGYAWWEGTSGAAPIVSGIVALIRAAHPKLSADSVIKRLIATAKPKSATVPDASYGYGLVDAAAAVTADVPTVTSNPLGELSDWVRVYRRAAPDPAAPAVPTPSREEAPAPAAGDKDVWQTMADLVPSGRTLTTVVVPIGLYLGFAAIFILGLVGGLRHFRRVRSK